jgi:hypothetical protein
LVHSCELRLTRRPLQNPFGASMTLIQRKGGDALRGKKLVFLVGAPRSGTTWLQLLLSRSPLVATGQETDLFNIFLRPMVDEWNRYRRTGEPGSLTETLTNEELRALLHNASGFVLAKIAQKKPSATIVLEKTPNHVRHWREILDLWPEAHFIHIIRDPRSVVASLRAASRSWGPGWGSSRISTISERWVADVSDGRRISQATGNYQEVRFQDLVADGAEILMRVFAKLGVHANSGECHQYVDQCRIEKLRTAALEAAPFDLARIGKYRFRIGTTDSWRTELSRWEIALVERLARRLMLELGFVPMTNKTVLTALVGMRCAGSDIARKLKRQLQWRFAEHNWLARG